MKRIAVLLIAISLVVFACHRKTVPVISDRTGLPSAPAVITPLYTTADIDAGNKIYSEGKCTRCHMAKPVENWTEAEWKSILKSMIPKARLDSVQRRQVTAYVNMHAKKG